jgi:hypothetical protein
MHGCKTWFLTLREERRLKVPEKRALGKMFGLKKDEVVGGWRNRTKITPVGRGTQYEFILFNNATQKLILIYLYA